MPTWAPSLRPFRSAMLVAFAALRALERDDGLAHVVVAGREVDGLLALGADRHLVDVEVEGLLTGREGLVEGHALPDDGALVVAELLRHGVGDGRLEALAVGGLVVLEPRLVRGLVGGDRQLAGRLGGQLALGAGVPGRPGRRGRPPSPPAAGHSRRRWRAGRWLPRRRRGAVREGRGAWREIGSTTARLSRSRPQLSAWWERVLQSCEHFRDGERAGAAGRGRGSKDRRPVPRRSRHPVRGCFQLTAQQGAPGACTWLRRV